MKWGHTAELAWARPLQVPARSCGVRTRVAAAVEAAHNGSSGDGGWHGPVGPGRLVHCRSFSVGQRLDSAHPRVH